MIALYLATVALLLAAGYLLHTEHRATTARLTSAHDEETGRLADDLANAGFDLVEVEIERDAYARKIDQLARDKTRAEVDLEWARIVIASQGLELDRHFLMPTVAGKRAEVADRRRQADNVVPLRDPKAGAR